MSAVNSMTRKPTLDDLFAALQDYSAKVQRAGYSPAKWEQARRELREAFEKFGIADHFDWMET